MDIPNFRGFLFRAASQVPRIEVTKYRVKFWDKLHGHPTWLANVQHWARNKQVLLKLEPAAFQHLSRIPNFLQASGGLEAVVTLPPNDQSTHVFGNV